MDSSNKKAPPQSPRPKPPPAAPPVYRPQPAPRVLQAKTAHHHHHHHPTPPRPDIKQPAAPPVYRPQPAPRVLQTKTAAPGPPPHAAARGPLPPQPCRLNPQARVAQEKRGVAGQQARLMAAHGAKMTPRAPGVIQRHLYKGFNKQNEEDLKGLIAQSPKQESELTAAFNSTYKDYDVRDAATGFNLVEVVFKTTKRGAKICDVHRLKASRPKDMKALRTVADKSDSGFQNLIHAAKFGLRGDEFVPVSQGMGVTPVAAKIPPRVKHEHVTIFRRATRYPSATKYVRDTIKKTGIKLGIDVDELDFQILHGVGHSQGGKKTQDAKNLGAGSSGANTEMIPFDDAVTGDTRISIETSFKMIPKTKIALEIEMTYYLTLEDGGRVPVFHRVIQGFRTQVTRSEYEGYESSAKALKAEIKEVKKIEKEEPSKLEAATTLLRLWEEPTRHSRSRSRSPRRRGRSPVRSAAARPDSMSPGRDRGRSRSRSRSPHADELLGILRSSFQAGDAVAKREAAPPPPAFGSPSSVGSCSSSSVSFSLPPPPAPPMVPFSFASALAGPPAGSPPVTGSESKAEKKKT